MELCDTPVECDLEIRADAVGVAVCKTGLPMTSFEGTKGNVEDLGKEGGFFSSEGEVPPQGRVLVFDNKGMVCDVGGGGRVASSGDAVVDVVTEVELAVEVLVVDTVEAVEVVTTLAPPLGGSCNLSSFFVGLSD